MFFSSFANAGHKFLHMLNSLDSYDQEEMLPFIKENILDIMAHLIPKESCPIIKQESGVDVCRLIPCIIECFMSKFDFDDTALEKFFENTEQKECVLKCI